jgi:hypothetical protein
LHKGIFHDMQYIAVAAQDHVHLHEGIISNGSNCEPNSSHQFLRHCAQR